MFYELDEMDESVIREAGEGICQTTLPSMHIQYAFPLTLEAVSTRQFRSTAQMSLTILHIHISEEG